MENDLVFTPTQHAIVAHAFAVALGLPTAWYAARAFGTGEAIAVGLAAIILVSVLVGLTKAETERIWLFMGPLVVGSLLLVIETAAMFVHTLRRRRPEVKHTVLT